MPSPNPPPTRWVPPPSRIPAAAPKRRRGTIVFNATPPAPPRVRRTFLLFSPWCDQGLGVQAREYVGWLRDVLGSTVVVFACRPSKPSGATAPTRMQADPAEWAGVTVEYIDASREAVPHDTLTAFAKKHGVTDALMLETCRRRIFVLSAALGSIGVRVYAVPNIEMVRRAELGHYRELGFAGVLCNNEYTRDVLAFFQVPEERLRLFPFALRDRPGLVRAAEHRHRRDPVRFLLVGGMNADRRKQATKVMQAFAAAGLGPAATLTVLCQGVDAVRAPAQQRHRTITVAHGHRPHAEVLKEYGAHHVVLMLSRAEGIGIGFHEAMRAGCALVTLDVAMYRELVSADRTGWLLPARAEDGVVGAKLIGNDDPIVRTYTFDQHRLTALFRRIVGEGKVAEMQRGSRRAFEMIYAEDRVRAAYRRALAEKD